MKDRVKSRGFSVTALSWSLLIDSIFGARPYVVSRGAAISMMSAKWAEKCGVV